MKLKLIFPLLFAAIIFVGCSSEEQINISNDEAQELIETPNVPLSRNDDPCTCDPTYVYPEKMPSIMYKAIPIEWAPGVTEEQKHCIRQRYFDCDYAGKAFWSTFQTTDPSDEHWVVLIGKPSGDLLNDVCEDPLTNSTQCDD